MERVDGSIQINNTEDMLFTYSEEEKQSIERNRENAKNIFSPEFIPYYLEEAKIFKLTPSDTIVYGFIRYYMKNSKGRFYFQSEDIGIMLNMSEGTVDNIFSKLNKIGLIDTGRKTKSGGGTIRFIKGVKTGDDLIKQGGGNISTSSNNELQYLIKQGVTINNNNINNNNTHSLSSNEDNSFVVLPSKDESLISINSYNNDDIVDIINNRDGVFVKLDNNKNQLVKNNDIVELNKKTHEIKQIFESHQKCGCISKSTKKTCLRKASYLIDGILYCNQHSRDILGDIINNNIEQGVFEKLWNWYGKKDAKQAAKKYFDKYIKTEYDINLLRYALPKYVESVKDKNYLVLLRTYLCEQRYLDYKEEFDLLNNKGNEIINNINEIETNEGFKLKFNRTYEN